MRKLALHIAVILVIGILCISSDSRWLAIGPAEPEIAIRLADGLLRTSWTDLDEVGSSRRCNQDTLRTLQNETPCAADPVDPDVAIVGANDYEADSRRHAAFYRTTDGGQSWQHSLTGRAPDSCGCLSSGDPSVCFDANGRIYATFTSYDCSIRQGVWTQVSQDHGATWSRPVEVYSQTGPASSDKDWSICDLSPASPYRGNHYVVWMSYPGAPVVYFSHSTDGGLSYSPRRQISIESFCWGPQVVVGPSGEVYVFWNNGIHHAVEMRRSLDGGITWGEVVRFGTWSETAGANPCGGFRVLTFIAAACDVSYGPHRGNLYVCWHHRVSGDDPDIILHRSTDGGETWSDAQVVSDDPDNRWQWWPAVTVHPTTGDIGVSWLDRREDPAGCRYACWGTVSTNGGLTWQPNVRIADEVSDPSRTSFLGDYTGVTHSRLGFLSAWPDTRNDAGDAYAGWWNNGSGLLLAETPPEVGLGQEWTIRWIYRYAPDSLRLELNRSNNPADWETLTLVNASRSFFRWQVSGDTTNFARLRLIGIGFPQFADTSDIFRIVPLAAPQDVTIAVVGSDVRLSWTVAGGDSYRIYSSNLAEGPFQILEGESSDNFFLDIGGINGVLKFYLVLSVRSSFNE